MPTIRSQLYTNPDAETITFNLAISDKHVVTIGGHRTLQVANVTVGRPFFIKIIQDSRGLRQVTWFDAINWPHGIVPTLTTTPGKADAFQFISTSPGNYDGFIIGQNL